MVKEIILAGIGTAVDFGNGVCVLNTTPHPINMQDTEGKLVSVPTSVLVNARAEEEKVSELFVKTVFVGTQEGKETIRDIKGTYKGTGNPATLVIVGSIIAAQAYPGEIVGLCPVAGFERVAPEEKRMCCDKFTTFA